MAEYWVSQGRRMCTYCKCWTADNKASIAFHEQGKNHKENVKRKLDELRKKGLEDARNRATESSDMAKIEKAALASLKKDLLENKEMSSAYGLSSEQVNAVTSKKGKQPTSGTAPTKADAPRDNASRSKESVESSSYSDWTSAYNEEGYLYYWNTVTNETSWYPPGSSEESSASSELQSRLPDTAVTKPATKSATTGYGQWETIDTGYEQPVADYDLPTDSKNNITAPEDIPLPPAAPDFSPENFAKSEQTEPQTKFKTKKVSLGSNEKSGEPVVFKKRKITKQRQTRGNLEED